MVGEKLLQESNLTVRQPYPASDLDRTITYQMKGLSNVQEPMGVAGIDFASACLI